MMLQRCCKNTDIPNNSARRRPSEEAQPRLPANLFLNEILIRLAPCVRAGEAEPHDLRNGEGAEGGLDILERELAQYDAFGGQRLQSWGPWAFMG